MSVPASPCPLWPAPLRGEALAFARDACYTPGQPVALTIHVLWRDNLPESACPSLPIDVFQLEARLHPLDDSSGNTIFGRDFAVSYRLVP